MTLLQVSSFIRVADKLFIMNDGYQAKQLYCSCGNELHGEEADGYIYYECDCGFYKSGQEARELSLLFRSDVI